MLDNSLSKLIARKIATDIFSGDLPPGEKVTEDVYALEFGTSRAPVREALYQLDTEGLIERIPRRGAYVKQYKKQEIRDLYEIRLTLELMAIDRLALPISTANRKEMDEMFEEMEVAIQENNLEKYTELNSRYHFQFIYLSESEVFKTLYHRLGSPLMALQILSFKETGEVKNSLDEHRLIWEFLLSGDIASAKDQLRKHNERAIVRISKNLK